MPEDLFSLISPFFPRIIYGLVLFLGVYFLALGIWRKKWWWCSFFGFTVIFGFISGLAFEDFIPFMNDVLKQFMRNPPPAWFYLLVFGVIPSCGLPLSVYLSLRGFAVEYAKCLVGANGYVVKDKPLIFKKGVTFKDIYKNKPNLNTFVCGSSGVGKTTACCTLLQTVFKDLPCLAFVFKGYDTTLSLPNFTCVNVAELPINAFFDRDAFITAYSIAFPLSKAGVMASSIPTLLAEALKGCNSWAGLISRLEAMSEDKRYSSLQKSAILDILSHVKTDLAPQYEPKDLSNAWCWDFKSNVALDFSRLNEAQKSFFAELVLNQVWNTVIKEGKRGFVLFVDEAHRILRVSQSGRFRSRLEEIARECRGFGGVLLVSSQNYSDLSPFVVNQFGTVFVFNSVMREDNIAFSTVSEGMRNLINELKPTLCIDFRGGSVWNVRVLRFRLPKLSPSPIYVQIDENLLKEVRLETVKPITVKPKVEAVFETLPPEKSVKRAVGETLPSPKPIDYDRLKLDVLRLLSDKASFVSQMGRDLANVYQKEANKLKVDIHVVLKDLVASGVVCKYPLRDRWGRLRVFYWLREKGESPFHKTLVDYVRSELVRHKIELFIETFNADLGFEFKGKKIAVECETGLKEDLKPFRNEVLRRFPKFNEVWVVVPTKGDKSRYLSVLGGVKNVFVLTLADLRSKLEA